MTDLLATQIGTVQISMGLSKNSKTCLNWRQILKAAKYLLLDTVNLKINQRNKSSLFLKSWSKKDQLFYLLLMRNML